MKKILEHIIAFIIILVVVIVGFVLYVGSTAYKPKWEIDKKDLKKASDVNYVTEDIEYALCCGSVTIYLGQSIDPSDYILLKDLDYKDKTAKHLLSQSRRYEIFAIEKDGNWYIHSLRTTNPGVTTSQGFEVGLERNQIQSSIKLKDKKVIEFEDGNKSIKLYFVSDILCEVYITYL